MLRKHFIIGETLYDISAKEAEYVDGVYSRVLLTDGTIIAINVATLNLLSYDDNSPIMREIIRGHYSTKENDKPYMLLNSTSSKQR